MAIKILSVTPNHGARGTEVKVEIQGTGFEPLSPPPPPPAPASPGAVAAPSRGEVLLSGGDVAVSRYAYVSPTVVTAVLALPAAPKPPFLRDVMVGGDTLKDGFIIE